MKISINIKIILPLTTILLSATNSNGECYEKNQGLINAVLNGNEEEVKYLLQGKVLYQNFGPRLSICSEIVLKDPKFFGFQLRFW